LLFYSAVPRAFAHTHVYELATVKRPIELINTHFLEALNSTQKYAKQKRK